MPGRCIYRRMEWPRASGSLFKVGSKEDQWQTFHWGGGWGEKELAQGTNNSGKVTCQVIVKMSSQGPWTGAAPGLVRPTTELLYRASTPLSPGNCGKSDACGTSHDVRHLEIGRDVIMPVLTPSRRPIFDQTEEGGRAHELPLYLLLQPPRLPDAGYSNGDMLTAPVWGPQSAGPNVMT